MGFSRMIAHIAYHRKRLNMYRGLRSVSRKSNLVLTCAGMPRSGSTWLYNAVRIAVQQAMGGCSDNGFVGFWVEKAPDITPGAVSCVKIHGYDRRVVKYSDVVFYSYRDVRDVLASLERFSGVSPSIEQADNLIRSDKFWRAEADFVMRYEDMIQSPFETMSGILSAFPDYMDTRKLDCERLLGELQSEMTCEGSSKGSYNKETLIHQGHRTHGGHRSWVGQLDPTFVGLIEDRHRQWLLNNQYETDT